jgi:Ca-activated chloride channel family protein
MKPFVLIVGLIAVTGAAMAYSSGIGKRPSPDLVTGPPEPDPAQQGIVKISGHLVQDKILQGSNGIVNLSLTLQADRMRDPEGGPLNNVDMVIVLDRSGSMGGRKIEYARRAVLNLLSGLSDGDRFALVTYSDRVQTLSPLVNMTGGKRKYLESIVRAVRAGGGTNLGAGLQTGINLLMATARSGNTGKVILISDGLANKGITDPKALGNIASVALEKEFAVSTVGVGTEFNEELMTSIADKGTGTYYYLENPDAFAQIFQEEFHFSQTTVATNVSVGIPMAQGVTLIDAAGYPFRVQDGRVIFHPGNLRSGQIRKLFLTLKAPSDKVQDVELGKIQVRYLHEGQPFEATLEESFKIACVKDRREVLSSIDKAAWSEKVVQEDFNRLKQEVARDIKAGRKSSAMDRIEKYHQEKETMNSVVGSAEVGENLDKDVNELRTLVDDTFQGGQAAVEQKQRSNSKLLQFEGYRGRRK